MSYTEKQLVELLQKASDAYYNNEPIMDDVTFDNLKDELERLNPEHPFLKQIGAPVENGLSVILPYAMPSLTKIKPETGAVGAFADSSKNKEWVLSEKLDGISVLWCQEPGKKQSLYLRGDGYNGVDISHLLPYIQGIPRGMLRENVAVRGELLAKVGSLPEGTLARSWVNGVVHQKTLRPEEVKKTVMLAYEVIMPQGMTRKQQMEWLHNKGWMTPWWSVVKRLDDKELGDLFTQRRTQCEYDMDGIVVGENCVPMKPVVKSLADVGNPKDMRAFKMPLQDQKAPTTVVDVIWSATYQGYWMPRIQIEPVMIGGSRIEFLTGHNARFILDNKLGKGAKIVVRKSGDVIPTLDHVIEPYTQTIQLPAGQWDGPEATAKHYKLSAQQNHDEHEDVIQKRLEHFAKAMEIDHLGPGLVAKFIKGGKKSIRSLLMATAAECQAILGKGMGEKIYNGLQNVKQNKTELDWMVGSGVMPRGIGSSKLSALFALEKDPRKWSSIRTCEGWSKDALEAFKPILVKYEGWRKSEIPEIAYPILPLAAAEAAAVATQAPVAVALPASQKQFFVFTGFRDAVAQDTLEKKGHSIQAAVNSKTTILVISDDAVHKETEKVKKARDLGIKILTRSQLSKDYL